LGNDDSCIDENLDTNSNEAEDTTDNNKEVDQLSKENADVAVEHKVDDDSKSVKVNLTSIPFVSYAPKASKPSTSSGME
jgi:activating signal cointegrator complex subunit 1